jgi:hypothetical protein
VAWYKDVDRYEFVLVLFYALLKREWCGWQFDYFFDGRCNLKSDFMESYSICHGWFQHSIFIK